MSLEQALAENTSAIKELIGVWGKLLLQGQNINARVEAGEVTTVTAGTVKVKVAEAPKPVATPAPTPTVAVEATTASVETAAASPSEPAKVVEIKDLSAAVTAAATRNRDGLVALLGKHNVKRASEVPQDKWAALVAELEAL